MPPQRAGHPATQHIVHVPDPSRLQLQHRQHSVHIILNPINASHRADPTDTYGLVIASPDSYRQLSHQCCLPGSACCAEQRPAGLAGAGGSRSEAARPRCVRSATP